ncbi:GSXL8-like protein [Mya arenaria]|uniref:Flavin-containing monooxygenase n=1 Tax=Mya arenaria TaxID=6604 RepID=A0ABY7EJU2_MYAAR|nr:GSXL8-like protein [Mya arenaria]
MLTAVCTLADYIVLNIAGVDENGEPVRASVLSAVCTLADSIVLHIAGVDENGEPVHASMYKYLWIIGGKEFHEFPDYTFEDHNGRWSKCAKSRLKDDKFNTTKIIVTVEDLSSKETREEVFTHVIIASGIFSFPNLPVFPGIENFPRRRVLLIGAGYSGESIATQLLKFGATHVTLAYRTKPKSSTCVIPESILEKPNVEYFESSKVFFKDGSSMEYDAVIFTTGYRNHFPFLQGRFRIDEGTSLYPAGLYNGTLFLNEGHNNLFYVGAQAQVHSFCLFESLAYWTCK